MKGKLNAQILLPLYGLILSPGKGILLYAPLLILFPYAIIRFWKRHHNGGIFVLLMLFFFLLSSAFYKDWHGDWAWGPRYLIPCLPFLFLPLGIFIQKGRGERIRGIVFNILFILGVLVQLPAMLINFSKYIRLVGETSSGNIYFDLVLTPIYGNWLILLSAFKRLGGYGSSLITIAGEMVNLAGKDAFDLWFINLYKVMPSLRGAIAISLLVILFLLTLSFFICKKLCNDYEQ